MVGAQCVKRILKLIGYIALTVWINTYKAKKMTRNEYLKEVFEACSYFWLEMADVKRHYQLLETTENTISVFVTHQDEEEAYLEVLHYDDDEHLIDDLISDL